MNGQVIHYTALWLATRMGNMARSSPLGITRCSFSIKWILYSRFGQDSWMLASTQSINMLKKNLTNIQPCILTSRFVNKSYVSCYVTVSGWLKAILKRGKGRCSPFTPSAIQNNFHRFAIDWTTREGFIENQNRLQITFCVVLLAIERSNYQSSCPSVGT